MIGKRIKAHVYCILCLTPPSVSPMDYDALSTVLNFDACETRSCVNVTIVDDSVDEQTEVFAVTLRSSVGLDSRIRLNPVDGVIEITDNDGKSAPDHT